MFICIRRQGHSVSTHVRALLRLPIVQEALERYMPVIVQVSPLQVYICRQVLI